MLNKPPAINGGRSEIPNGIIYSQLKNKSLFNPPVHNNEHIEVLNKMVLQDLEKLKIKKMKDPQDIRKGIKEREDNKNVVIRPADKGGAIVVLSKEYYNNELMEQLNDINTYIKLRGKPTRQYKSELQELIQRGSKKNILTKKEERYLIPETCRVRSFILFRNYIKTKKISLGDQ